jgi:phosphate transport system protein
MAMNTFERDLAALKGRVLEMGTVVETMAADVARALVGGDPASTGEVRVNELAIDRLQMEVDGDAIRLITKYSPAARDLRLLLMIARINSDLERVGDHAVDLCEYVELLSIPTDGPLPELEAMSRATLAMLHDALEAFRAEDLEAAEAVIRRDDEVDAMNGTVTAGLLARGISDVAAMPRGIGLLLAARSLERIADHATNICEDIFFVVTGQDIRHRIESGRNGARTPALPWRVSAPGSRSTPW